MAFYPLGPDGIKSDPNDNFEEPEVYFFIE